MIWPNLGIKLNVKFLALNNIILLNDKCYEWGRMPKQMLLIIEKSRKKIWVSQKLEIKLIIDC